MWTSVCVCVLCVTTWLGMLLWLTSSRFSKCEWNSGQWTMETPSRFSTMKPTVQSSGRRILADVCSNREPLEKPNAHTENTQQNTNAWRWGFFIDHRVRLWGENFPSFIPNWRYLWLCMFWPSYNSTQPHTLLLPTFSKETPDIFRLIPPPCAEPLAAISLSSFGAVV